VSARLATPADADAVTRTVALAFASDPVWMPALVPLDDAQRLTFWRYWVEGALRFDLSTLIEGPQGEVAAVALWIAPSEHDMSDDALAELEAFVRSSMPDSVTSMLELWARFDEHHPADPPHAYLNFLATHPEHRGAGIAQGLLAETLARFDAAGIPTYLESTNPANDHRYVRAGYTRIGEFASPHTGGPIGRMWRDALVE
jgi:ribosomal protein S18 acetylase RimI-like enzyme